MKIFIILNNQFLYKRQKLENRKFYTKRLESSEKFKQDRKSLKLLQNTEGIYECRGKIQEVIQSIYRVSHCSQKKTFGLHN